MKTRELARRFNGDLDKMLDGQEVTAENESEEYRATLQLAHDLINAQSYAEHAHAAKLKARLLVQVGGSNRSLHRAWIKPFAVTVGVLLLIGVSVATLPPVKVFAQEVLRRIGNFIFVNEPSYAEQYVATMQSGTPTPTVDPNQICQECVQAYEEESLNFEQAGQKAGFTVYRPGYIPDGYTLIGSSVLDTGQSVSVDTSFKGTLPETMQDNFQTDAFIAIEQSQLKLNAEEWVSQTGEVQPLPVIVRGLPGAWLEQVPVQPYQDENGNWKYVYWNQLIWEEEGFQFVLQTNAPLQILTKEELLLIAESLVK